MKIKLRIHKNKVYNTFHWKMNLPDGNEWTLVEVGQWSLPILIKHACEIWQNFYRR